MPEWVWWGLVWLLVSAIVALVVGAILRDQNPDQAAPGSPPDDIGKPDHSLCWSLAAFRAGNEVGAAKKLRQAMLSNLYLVPYLIGAPIAELSIWHGSSDAELSFVGYIPEQYLQLWTDKEREWASRLYESPGFRSARARYIEISELLDSTRPGPERSRLVREMHKLER